MKKLALVVSLFAVMLLVFSGSFGGPTYADPKPTSTVTPTPTPSNLKVNICHSDGQSGNYSSITININSVTDCTGAAGHDRDSQDIIPSYTYGTCTYAGKNLSQVSWIANNCSAPTTPTPTRGTTPTPTSGVTPTPTIVVTPTPTSGVTPTPTVICNADHDCVPTPTPTTVVTPTPSGNGGQGQQPNNPSDGLSDGKSSCPECTQAPIQAVLGASTMADTGTFEDTVMNFVLLGGMLSMGAAAYAKAKKA